MDNLIKRCINNLIDNAIKYADKVNFSRTYKVRNDPKNSGTSKNCNTKEYQVNMNVSNQEAKMTIKSERNYKRNFIIIK